MTDWARRHKWWADAARLYLGLITRAEATKRGVPHMTVPPYAAELRTLQLFSLWVHWYNAGRHNGRPDFELPVPRWAWVVENEWHREHRQPKPPPPPEPEHKPKPKPSWTLANGPWIFVESDPGSCPPGPWTRLDIRENEIAPGAPLWYCPKGVVPQMEGGNQAVATLDFLDGIHVDLCSIAPVTTLGIDPAPYLELGVTSVFVECYLQGQSNALDKMWYADKVEGWPDPIPCIGVGWADKEGTFGFSDYAGWLTQLGVGPRFGVYASDPMSAKDWSDLRAYLGT